MVQRVAEAGALRQLRRTCCRHAISGEAVLEVFGPTRCAPGLVQPDEEQEYARRGNDPENKRGAKGQGWHLDPPERSVQLIRGWLGGRCEDMFRNVFTFRTEVLHSHRDHPGVRDR